MRNSETFQQFQDFYEEILRQKERALNTPEVAISFNEQDSSQHQVALDTFEKVQRDLKSFFDNKKISKEIQYAMVALADEIFLTLPWATAAYWKNALLETHFFSSQMAGEVIYQKIDSLIKTYNASQSELALVYFLTLTLGFQGQYQDYPEKIQVYIKALYTLTQKEYPKLHMPGIPFLIPQCYDNILDAPPHKGLPDMRMWIMNIASVIIIYIFATYVLWYNFVTDIYVYLR